MAMSMIAERIHKGETAKQIGISEQQYNSRKETLDRYLATTGGDFEPTKYSEWLSTDTAGDPGTQEITTTKGLRIERVTRPCPSCGGGKIR